MTESVQAASVANSTAPSRTVSSDISSGLVLAVTSTFTTKLTSLESINISSTLTSINTKVITTVYPPSASNGASHLSSTSTSTSALHTSPSSRSSATSPSSSASLTAATSAAANSGGVSSGAAAGIGIGCAIIGALLALAFGFFFFRKRNASQPQSTSHGVQKSPSTYTADKEAMVFGNTGTQRPASADGLDDILPQEADDSTIRKKASTLFDQFELHIENFYTDVKVPITPAMEAELSRYNSPHLPEPLMGLLKVTSSPTTLIKHCLAYHVISSTSPVGGSTTRSLLPPGASELMSAVNKGPATRPNPDTGLALSRWRQLTAYLRPDILSFGGPGTTPDPDQARTAEEAAIAFSRAFSPWARPEHTESERIGHLTHIVNSAVFLAIWLFAQPASCKYDWKAPAADNMRDRGGGAKAAVVVVVVPGLVKVSDGRGRILQGGQHGIVGPVVKRI